MPTKQINIYNYSRVRAISIIETMKTQCHDRRCSEPITSALQCVLLTAEIDIGEMLAGAFDDLYDHVCKYKWIAFASK